MSAYLPVNTALHMVRYAISLYRVSTNKQFQDGGGIKSQRSRGKHYADRNNIVIEREFLEHYSGRSLDRRVVEEMENYVKQSHGRITVLLIPELDRLTRAGSPEYLGLKKRFARLGVAVVDAFGVIQETVNTMEHLGVSYEWSERSPSQIAEVLLAEQANAEASSILIRCISGQIGKARQGYEFNDTTFGFSSERVITQDGGKAVILVPREPEAEWMRTMFTLRAEGLLSDQAICDRLNAMGFRSRKFHKRDSVTRQIIGYGGEKPLDVKKLKTMIARPVYCGIREMKWTEALKLPGNPGLVSIETFNRANRGKVAVEEHQGTYRIVRNKQNYGVHKTTEEFSLRHVVVCPKCGKPLLGSKSRGKSGNHFGYYHCSRKHAYFGVKQEEFESTVAKTIKRIAFKKKYLGILKEVVRDVWVQKNGREQDDKKRIISNIQDLKTRQEDTLRSFRLAQSELIRKGLEADYEDLERQIESALIQLEQHSLQEQEIEAYFQSLKVLMEHPEQWLIEPTSKEILRKNWNMVFRQPPTYQELKDGTPRMTLALKLLHTSGGGKSRVAGLLCQQWNTFTEDVRRFLADEGDPRHIPVRG